MTFQEQINLLRAGGVPMPLTSGQATAQAVRLRSKGIPYTSIAVVMAAYHGYWITAAAWQRRCRDAGSAPKHNSTGPRVPPRKRAS